MPETFDIPRARRLCFALLSGAVAQLGERLNGIQEVEGSTPFGSTNLTSSIPSQESPNQGSGNDPLRGQKLFQGPRYAPPLGVTFRAGRPLP